MGGIDIWQCLDYCCTGTRDAHEHMGRTRYLELNDSLISTTCLEDLGLFLNVSYKRRQATLLGVVLASIPSPH